MSGPYAGLAGHRLPGARIVLEPHVAWLWAGCVHAEPSAETPDPSVGWLLAMRATGLPLDALFGLVDARADSGVVLGESELELRRPLRTGGTYDGTAEVLDVVRKTGARAGTIDLLRLRIALTEPDADDPAFVLTNTMVFPRGAAA